MLVLEFEQGSADWHKARRCRVTGSKFSRVMGTAEARRGLIAELIAEEATEQSKVTRPTEEMERGTAEEAFSIKAYEEQTGEKVDRVGMVISEEHNWLGVSPDGLIKKGKEYVKGIETKSPDSKNAILYRIENMIPMEETGLLSKFTKDEMMGVLHRHGIDYDVKAKIADLEPLLPEGEKGKPSSQAPFLGVPSEYKWQVVLQFVVIPTLKSLDFLVYDARFIDPEAKLYIVTVERDHPLMQAAIAEANETLIKFRADWMKWKEIVLPINF